jgi:hypothetical protein
MVFAPPLVDGEPQAGRVDDAASIRTARSRIGDGGFLVHGR